MRYSKPYVPPTRKEGAPSPKKTPTHKKVATHTSGCYEAALTFASENRELGWRVVHGVNASPDATGNAEPWGHGWVEVVNPDGDHFAYDPMIDCLVTAAQYHHDQQVTYAVDYSLEEAAKLHYEVVKWGPWDPVVRAARHV